MLTLKENLQRLKEKAAVDQDQGTDVSHATKAVYSEECDQITGVSVHGVERSKERRDRARLRHAANVREADGEFETAVIGTVAIVTESCGQFEEGSVVRIVKRNEGAPAIVVGGKVEVKFKEDGEWRDGEVTKVSNQSDGKLMQLKCT